MVLAAGHLSRSVRPLNRLRRCRGSGAQAERSAVGAAAARGYTTTPPGAPQLNVLLVNGYSPVGRERLASHGCTDAAVLYARMLESITRAHGVELRTEVIRPASEGFGLPSEAALAGFDAIAWTGSDLTIHAEVPEVLIQLELARMAYAARIPQFGSCWGMQVAAQSAGIATLPNPNGREQGLCRKVTATADGVAHPMFRESRRVFDGFSAHTDMVCLESARAASTGGDVECAVLAGNKWTPVQALAVKYKGGEFWGVQYHPEFDLGDAARKMLAAAPLLIGQGTFTSEADVLNHADMMFELAEDPTRMDLKLRLGVDEDVLDPEIRESAVSRWMTDLVYPLAEIDAPITLARAYSYDPWASSTVGEEELTDRLNQVTGTPLHWSRHSPAKMHSSPQPSCVDELRGVLPSSVTMMPLVMPSDASDTRSDARHPGRSASATAIMIPRPRASLIHYVPQGTRSKVGERGALNPSRRSAGGRQQARKMSTAAAPSVCATPPECAEVSARFHAFAIAPITPRVSKRRVLLACAAGLVSHADC